MGVFRRNGVWVIDYYDGFRRRRKAIGPAKGEAKKILAEKRLEVRRGGREDRPRLDAPRFDQFIERYKEYSRANKRGFYNERYRIQQIAEFFGKRKLSDLRRWDAEALKIKLSKTLAPATVNRLLGNLKHMMSMAVAWNILASNPFSGVKLLRVPKRTERVLSEEEEAQLLAACGRVRAPHLRSCVVLALNTGMRKGEILGLRWENVDLGNRLITLYNGKTTQSDRRIPMNEIVFGLLSDLRKQTNSDFIFPSTRKKDDRFRDPKVGFMKAMRLAKIPHLRFHDLRHTFATRLVRVGVDLVTVQHLMGHSTISMTTRYAHSLADDKMAAVRRLDFAGVR